METTDWRVIKKHRGASDMITDDTDCDAMIKDLVCNEQAFGTGQTRGQGKQF